MVSMYLILTFQDINDKITYTVIVYGIVTIYGISTLVQRAPMRAISTWGIEPGTSWIPLEVLIIWSSSRVVLGHYGSTSLRFGNNREASLLRLLSLCFNFKILHKLCFPY